MTKCGNSLILWICCASLIMRMSSADDHKSRNLTALFVFGDSHLDPGNNNYINTSVRANFTPYGESYFPDPTGRFTDGRTMADFIAEFANLTLLSPYRKPEEHDFLQGANFASAGAGAQDIVFEGYVIPLTQQLEYFKKVELELNKKLGNDEAKNLISKAVYFVSIGGNDILVPFIMPNMKYLITTDNSYEQYAEIILGNVTTVVKELYSEGARKFAFLGLDSVGCEPGMRQLANTTSGCCHEDSTKIAELYNTLFVQNLEKLAKELQGFKYAYLDSYTLMKDIASNLSKYGMEEGIIACCGSGKYRADHGSCGRINANNEKDYDICPNPHEYVYFDNAHFTEEIHKQHAKTFWSGPPSIPGSYTFEQLIRIP